MFRHFVVLCVICITNINFSLGMSREQLKKTMTIMKNQCMPKNGVTNDEVGEIERGVFLEDHNVMCYIACVYKTIQVFYRKPNIGPRGVFQTIAMRIRNYTNNIHENKNTNDKKAWVRNNRLDKDLILRQIDILYPTDIKEAVKKSVTKCVTVQNLYEDPCEGIFYATRCLYADDPSKFIFP